ncbi:hypothetical protein BSKO_03853 [Bryopsis sp. KO-2023]|nr:hypothetical protein BSKO_03853 [Bryopsis sp. KO-2023]
MAKSGQEDDVAKLFGEAPVVPVSTGGPAYDAVPSTSAPTGFGNSGFLENTLDEPLSETIKRDFVRIGKNLRIVLFPFNVGTDRTRSLRNWDLWGPLIFVLILALVLVSNSEQDANKVFPVVFSVLGCGALVLTLNIVLLGGTIVFFQSLCLLGYCLFPLDVAAIISAFSPAIVRFIVVILALVWSTYAAVPFAAESVPITRRALAVFPVVLLYMSAGWMIFVM